MGFLMFLVAFFPLYQCIETPKAPPDFVRAPRPGSEFRAQGREVDQCRQALWRCEGGGSTLAIFFTMEIREKPLKITICHRKT